MVSSREDCMSGNVTNLNHKKAHDLIVEYKQVLQIKKSVSRLAALVIWLEKVDEYGEYILLDEVS